MKKLPIDYLPIVRPLEDTNPLPDDMWFYENIVIKLLPDIIRLEATGIPIDLTKVKKVEETVNDVLENVQNTLADNKLIKLYLSIRYNDKERTTIQQTESKQKSFEDFLKPFDPKNKVHRSFVVNTYLHSIGRDDMQVEEWSKKDLKKLNQIIASKFISDILYNNIQGYMEPILRQAMVDLATQKAEIYNSNRLEAKREKLAKERDNLVFNPNSPQQKQQFFDMLGIESEYKTKAGSPQWDRKSLETLNKLLESMLEKEKENVSS